MILRGYIVTNKGAKAYTAFQVKKDVVNEDVEIITPECYFMLTPPFDKRSLRNYFDKRSFRNY